MIVADSSSLIALAIVDKVELIDKILRKLRYIIII